VQELVRAWKDVEYRDTGTGHPAGEIVIDPVGGMEAVNTEPVMSFGCCDTNVGCTHPWGCPETLYGTCGAFTIGCCYPPVLE
jgi:hypothetical protein